MVVDPLEILDMGSPYRLNDTCYINKQTILALQRIFGLLGVGMKEWYSDIHRPLRSAFSKSYSYGPSSGSAHEAHSNKQIMSRKHAKRSRIDSYYLSRHCCLCGGLAESSAYVCNGCSTNEAVVAAIIVGKTSKLERERCSIYLIYVDTVVVPTGSWKVELNAPRLRAQFFMRGEKFRKNC